MRQLTSAETYRDLEVKGALRGVRAELAQAFGRFGPGTSAEVLRKAALDQNRNLMRARVTELADAGLLVQNTIRMCKITGRRAIVWRSLADDEPPCPREKPLTVSLSDSDLQAVADFQSGKRGQFCPLLAAVHAKILAASAKRGEKRPIGRVAGIAGAQAKVWAAGGKTLPTTSRKTVKRPARPVS